MHKLNRERAAFIASQGLDLRRVERRRKHVAFVCAEGTIFAATTPSDRREDRNFRAHVKRLVRS